MLFRSTLTAVQLQSVAARYRGQLMPREVDWNRLRKHLMLAVDGIPHNDGSNKLQRLEAVLFLARQALGSRKISQYANLADATEVRTLIRQLNQKYADAGRAFCIEEVAGGYRMHTHAKFGPWIRRLEYIPRETRLSAPAMETLAVVAYRQPALRADIEAIRGVNCGEVLRQLMERELVRVDGRSNELGRPYLYATTGRFLQVFGLRTLDELPRKHQFMMTEKSPPESESDLAEKSAE